MRLLLLFTCLFFSTSVAFAQRKTERNRSSLQQPLVAAPIDSELFSQIEWRNIGPFRGGRSAAVCGVPGKPKLFYFGSTGGGVWRTEDGGRSWKNISDPYFGGSIGAIAVAPSDPNVLYAGGGEVTVRGNVSAGSGMWRSEDAGRSWKNAGLPESRQIPRILVHPGNPDLVYAAVLGDLFKDSAARGVYRSKDGGKNWEKVLFVNESAGAVDLCMDPSNPRILYASCWRVRRTPWSFSSGGAGSSLWKSTDSGDTWTEISRNEGMPTDTLGIIGVCVSPVNPDRVWAIVESQTGGVFRSDNGGKTWKKTNEDRALRQRAWYYTRIYADPADAEVVYVLNVNYHKSKDGGSSFSRYNAPHGDHHDLWIAPEDPKRMIIGDDGGAQISYDGGQTWSTYHNQPTAQFYRLTADNIFPYRIYGAQQDNSTVRIAHRTAGYQITDQDWESTAGGESGHIAVDPLNNDIVYGGSYHGYLTRYDHKSQIGRQINVWPEDNMGHGAEDARYRFQWNYPIFFSPHDPHELYAAGNRLHLSENEGQSWTAISPDLTTNDREKQKSSGGPITQDNTSVEYYCTIFAVAESPIQAGVLWTGSDDGLVQLSKDGGETWTNVTPPDLPKWIQINSLEPDPFQAGGCYFAATAYKLGDNTPYIYKTNDFGASWEKLVRGINPAHFTRVVRCDPARQGLLYAGTEAGMYISFDDGRNWQSFQQNLPIVPVTDLLVKNDNLIAATQGRSIWIIDDLSVVRQMDPNILSQKAQLYQTAPAYRTAGGGNGKAGLLAGGNRHNGVFVNFFLKEKPEDKDSVSLAFFTKEGALIKEFTSKSKENPLPLHKGGNRFIWDMRYPDAEKFDGMVLWSYGLEGPKAVPGIYTVRLQAWGETYSSDFEILPDPRSAASAEDYKQQFEFVQSVSDKITAAHKAIKEIRQLRSQLNDLKLRLPKDEKYKPIRGQMAQIDSAMSLIENALYQTKNRSSQDPLNYPVRLNDKLANLMGLNVEGDFPPTDQSLEVRAYLFSLTDVELANWEKIKTESIPALNQMIREKEVDLIRLKE